MLDTATLLVIVGIFAIIIGVIIVVVSISEEVDYMSYLGIVVFVLGAMSIAFSLVGEEPNIFRVESSSDVVEKATVVEHADVVLNAENIQVTNDSKSLIKMEAEKKFNTTDFLVLDEVESNDEYAKYEIIVNGEIQFAYHQYENDNVFFVES